jgi:phosphoadenosine phosphosulfate reductase
MGGYDYKRLETLVAAATRALKGLIATSGKNLIAYSGGKDSIVATHLATGLGIRNAVSEISFQFTSATNDVKKSADFFGLNIEYKEGLSLEWLKKNPKYIYSESKLQAKIYSMRQQRTVKKYSKEGGYTGVVYGRRTEENTVKSELYKLKSNVWQCHPLRDWKTEDIWAYIYTHKLPYPKLYETEIGIKEGFTPYLIIPSNFKDKNVWRPIYDVEPQIVKMFSKFHEPAMAYLETR